MINIEWGNFFCEELVGLSGPSAGGSQDCFRLPADVAIDEASPNKGKQYFEKMTAGMYLGEISRRTAIAIMEEECGEPLSSFPPRPFALTTPMMADVEACAQDADGEQTMVGIVCTAFGVPSDEKQLISRFGNVLRRVCPLIRARAAQLIAAALAAVLSVALSKTEGGTAPRRVAVAVDGGLYEHYGPFREDLNRTIASLFHEFHQQRRRGRQPEGQTEYKIDVSTCCDGSAFGAAVIAAKTL